MAKSKGVHVICTGLLIRRPNIKVKVKVNY